MYSNLCRSGIVRLVYRTRQIPTCRPSVTARLTVRTRVEIRSYSSTPHVDASKTSTPDLDPEFAPPNSSHIEISTSTASPKLSENSPDDLPQRVDALLRMTPWTLTSSQMGVSRSYTFKTFSAAWQFMSLVVEECKRRRHHPSWHNLYNEVTVEWTTHRPQGLSFKDIDMAEFCEQVAKEIGVKDP